MRTLRQLYATITLTYISFFVLGDFFEESIVHVALVSAYCICKKNLLEKRHYNIARVLALYKSY